MFLLFHLSVCVRVCVLWRVRLSARSRLSDKTVREREKEEEEEEEEEDEGSPEDWIFIIDFCLWRRRGGLWLQLVLHSALSTCSRSDMAKFRCAIGSSLIRRLTVQLTVDHIVIGCIGSIVSFSGLHSNPFRSALIYFDSHLDPFPNELVQ